MSSFNVAVFRIATILSVALLSSACSGEFIVDFGTGSVFTSIPYSEDGLSFAANPNSSLWQLGPTTGTDRQLRAATNGLASVRVTSSVGPINLLALDVQSVFVFNSTWTMTNSRGEVATISNGNPLRTIDLPASAWTGISFFDITGNGDNASIRIDNIRFELTTIPEPATTSLFAMCGIGIVARLAKTNRARGRKRVQRSA